MSQSKDKQTAPQSQPQYQEDSAWKPMMILLIPLLLVLLYGYLT